MQYLLNRKVYLTSIFVIILFTSSILYLLYTNLDVNKKHTYIENYLKTEYTAQFITSDMERIIHGIHELINGINITEEHIEDDINHDKTVTKILKNHLENYLLSLVMTDHKGNIIHWTRDIKKIDIKYRPYIKYHLTNTDISKSLFVDEARLSIVEKNKEFFAISKGFYKDAKLKNIIIAFVDMGYLKKRYKKYIQNQTLTIASSNGKMYFRIPSQINCCGKELKEIKDFVKKDIDKEDKVILSSIDKENKLTTLIRSNNFSIVTSVEIYEKEILASWQNHRNQIFFISLFILILSIFLIVYYTKLQSRIDKLTQLDALTQIYNRGYFTSIARKEFAKAKRFNQSLPLMMIDIDDFKKINDTYGHQTGDKVIKRLALTLQNNIRDIDSCARYGGEEFVVLLPNTDINGATLVAERIKENFKKQKYRDKFITTISIGISDIKSCDKHVDDIIKRADEAMYLSKKEGKDSINLIL